MKESGTCTPDEQLARARAGETAAFTMLVREHQRSVYSLALRMLGNRETAEDLAQEVFLQLHRKLTSIESGAHLASWLRKVTTNRAIDRLRRKRQPEADPMSEELVAADHGDPLVAQSLRGLIMELPAAARAVLLLRYQEDLDPGEIARVLEMPVNTVKSHLKRSLISMRERILAQDGNRDEASAAGVKSPAREW